jgi:dolichol-phosphate mannosyltransferase
MRIAPSLMQATWQSPEAITKVPDISVIIPVFNKGSKVGECIDRVKQIISPMTGNFEVIVVNDGSTDDSLDKLQEIAKNEDHLKIISYTPNKGKGFAVKSGVLMSKGNVVMFLDGDLDILPESIREYVARLNNCDLVIASKWHPQSNVHIPPTRAFLSKGFHFVVRLATGISQTDTQTGLKVGNGNLMRAIFGSITVNRYAFDVELFTIASLMRARIEEMPVTMTINHRFNMKEILRMFVNVAQISFNYKFAHKYPRVKASIAISTESLGQSIGASINSKIAVAD